MVPRIVTYSPSLTLPLTRACTNRCLYCGYWKDDDGLLSQEIIRSVVGKAHEEKVSEILILSGEKADKSQKVQRDLRLLGMESFISYTKNVCEYLLKEGILSHVNIGTLDMHSLEQLREVSASMGLMIEGVNEDVNAKIHPGKNLKTRIETIELAGRLQIPFTTGILLGVGEEQRDRIASILTIKQIHQKYHHIQEIILQKYITNEQSRLPAKEISSNEMKEIVAFCKVHLPDVSLQVPPNLDPEWKELVAFGVNDLGGIGSGLDFVNPGNPWPEIPWITKEVEKVDGILRKRLPIYPRFYRLGWYSNRVGEALLQWIEGHDEYSYYSQ